MPRPVNVGQIAAGEGQAAVDALVANIASTTAANLAGADPIVLGNWMRLILSSPDFASWQAGFAERFGVTRVFADMPQPNRGEEITPSNLISAWNRTDPGAYLYVGPKDAPTSPVLVLLSRDSATRLTVIEGATITYIVLRAGAASGSSIVSFDTDTFVLQKATGATQQFSQPEYLPLSDMATKQNVADTLTQVTTDWQAALGEKADKVHGHEMGDITDLVAWKNLVAAELLKKADKVHAHKIADVEQLEQRLADNYQLVMEKANISDDSQTVNLGTLMFSGNFVMGVLDHPDYGYRLFAASPDMFDGDIVPFAFGTDLEDLYKTLQREIADAVTGGVDLAAIQQVIDDAIANGAAELVTLAKHNEDLALKADKSEVNALKTTDWQNVTLATGYKTEAARPLSVRLSPDGQHIQMRGVLMREDEEPLLECVDKIVRIGTLPGTVRPKTWVYGNVHGWTKTDAVASLGVVNLRAAGEITFTAMFTPGYKYYFDGANIATFNPMARKA